MKYYVGFDPSLTGFGAAVVTHDSTSGFSLAETAHLKSSTKSGRLGARLNTIWTELDSIIGRYEPALSACETPSFGSYSSPYTLGAVQGIVHLVTFRTQTGMYGVTPTQLKKFAAKKGNATKEQVAEALRKDFNLPIDPDTPDDVTDAIALALIAASIGERVQYNVRARAEVIYKVQPYRNFSKPKRKKGKR